MGEMYFTFYHVYVDDNQGLSFLEIRAEKELLEKEENVRRAKLPNEEGMRKVIPFASRMFDEKDLEKISERGDSFEDTARRFLCEISVSTFGAKTYKPEQRKYDEDPCYSMVMDCGHFPDALKFRDDIGTHLESL
jgi:hypothetical protein